MKKIFAFFAFLLLFGPSVATAQSFDLPSSCQGQYLSFMKGSRSKNLKDLGLKDIMGLSDCRLNDLVLIDEEIDLLREELRSASSSCSPMDDLQIEYLKLKLESYYVRHLLKVDVSTLSEAERAKILENSTQQFELLEAEMLELFVNQEGKIGEDLLTQYLEEWRLKYAERIVDYVDCKAGDFSQISESWNGFMQTLKDLSLKAEEKTPEELAAEKEKEEEETKQIFQPLVDAFSIFKGKRDQKVVNEVKPPQTVDQLATGGGGQNFTQVFDDLREEEDRFTLEFTAVSRQARYAILYGNNGAAGGDALQEIVKDLNAVVESSNTTSFPRIIEMSSKVYNRQCE